MPAVSRWEILCTGRAHGTNRYVLEGRKGLRQWVGLTGGSQSRLRRRCFGEKLHEPGSLVKMGPKQQGLLGKDSHCFPKSSYIRNTVSPTPPQKVRRCGVGPRCLVLKSFPGDMISPRIGSPFIAELSSQSRATPQLPNVSTEAP